MHEHRHRLEQQVRAGHMRALGLTLFVWVALATWFGSMALAQTVWSSSLVQPQGWVQTNQNILCQIQVSDPAGLQNAAEYRISTTGQSSLSAASWATGNLQIGEPALTTRDITVSGLSFSDSVDQNWIQFRIKRADDSLAESPAYRVLVDATKPQNPAQLGSTSHTVGQWSNDNVIRLSWSGATDATSQIFGYSYQWDHSPSTVPDEAADVTANQVTSLPLSEGDDHYFHLRTRDNARNWTTDALHSGPYFIDVTAPDVPGSVSSSTHTPGQWSDQDTIQVSWSPAEDNLSGVGAYWFAWDHVADTVPAAMSTTLQFAMSPVLSDSDNIWFHLRSMDAAQNWSTETLHVGPFQVDKTPPILPSSFQSSHTVNQWSNQTVITMTWEAATDPGGSGVAGYAIAWDQNSGTIPAATIVTTGTEASSPQLAHNTHNYFHLRAVDEAGNWSETLHRGPYHVDTQAPTTPAGLSSEPLGWSNTDSFTVRWAANPPDPSGIGGAFAKLGSPPASNSDFDIHATGEDLTEISNISVGSDGPHYIYIWLEDSAGNSNYQFWISPANPFRLDRVPPTTQHNLDREPDNNGWYTDTLTIQLESNDTLSRVAVISYTVDSGPVQALSESGFVLDSEGVHEVRYYGADRAGNVETANLITPLLQIDLNPPASSLPQVEGSGGLLGWFTSTVTVTLHATDSASGIDEFWHRSRRDGGAWGAWTGGSEFVLGSEGQHELEYYAIDKAGLQEAVQSMEGMINIDRVAPSTHHSLSGTSGENGWFVRSPVQLTLQATDARSGVSETKYRLDGGTWQTWEGLPIALSGDGLHTVEYYSADQAGNVERVGRATVGIDSVAPALIDLPQVSPEQTWYNKTDFSLSWTPPPNETSGVVGVYYKFGTQAPRSNSDYDGECVSSSELTSCDGLVLPGEGRFGIWVWLRDKAGNADYRTRRYLPDTIWYDATPPETTLKIAGEKQGQWYSSAVTITFTATDPQMQGVNAVSGIGVISYSIGYDGPWQAANPLVIDEEGTTTIYYRAQDNAGNTEGARNTRIRIDQTPPPSPENVTVSPTDWSPENRFTVAWENPGDFTIAGAYYSHQEPTGPEDGTFITGSDMCFLDCQAEIQVPGEGKWDLYLWLTDSAGNSGWQGPHEIQDAFLYDVTAPAVSHQLEGTEGRSGWWVSTVRVHLTGEDAVDPAPNILYRLRQGPTYGWGEWQAYTGPITLKQQGANSIRYYARDEAGNEGNAREFEVKIDTFTPRVSILSLPDLMPAPNPTAQFIVGWTGVDPLPGSGIAGYGILSRNGLSGEWEDWQSGTTEQWARFDALPGHVYYFRARARDVAGNIGPLSGMEPYGEQRTFVQSVVNGEFETPGLAGWESGGVLLARSVVFPSHNNVVGPVALLGRPELGRGIEYVDGDPIPTVPVGYGAITQTITIPPLEDLAEPVLSFWYRVYSYDIVIGGSTGHTLFDSLDVHILDTDDHELEMILRDGDYSPWPKPVPQGDTGWKEKKFSLVPYAGQTIKIRFQCWNRPGGTPKPIGALDYYNTYAYIDKVQVTGQLPGQTLHLPAILKNW